MPTSEPMSNGEIARLMESLTGSLRRIEEKLDAKPDKDALDFLRDTIRDMKTDQLRKDDTQDAAIYNIEQRVSKELADMELRLDKLLFGVIGAATTGLVGIIVGIATATPPGA